MNFIPFPKIPRLSKDCVINREDRRALFKKTFDDNTKGVE